MRIRRPRRATAPPGVSEERRAPATTGRSQRGPGGFPLFTTFSGAGGHCSSVQQPHQGSSLPFGLGLFCPLPFRCAEILILGDSKIILAVNWVFNLVQVLRVKVSTRTYSLTKSIRWWERRQCCHRCYQRNRPSSSLPFIPHPRILEF